MFAAKGPPQRRSNSSKLFFFRRNNLSSKVSFEENTSSGGSRGPQPSTTSTNTMAWERRTCVDRVASWSKFGDHVQADIPAPANCPPAPSTYMTPMYNKHYTLSTTHYHAPTDTWLVHGTSSLLPADYTPSPHSPDPNAYIREDKPDEAHIRGRWGQKSLETLLSIRSGNQGLGRAM